MTFFWTILLVNVSLFAVCTLATIVLIGSAPKIENDEPAKQYRDDRGQKSKESHSRFYRTRFDKRILQHKDKRKPAVTPRKW